MKKGNFDLGHPVLKVQYTRAIDRLSNLMIFAQSTNANLMCASHLDELECWLPGGALGGDDVDGVAVDEAVAEEADPVALPVAVGRYGGGLNSMQSRRATRRRPKRGRRSVRTDESASGSY